MSAGDWKEFYNAANDGHFDLVQVHVKAGINLNYQHPEIQMTALVAAIKNGHTDIAMLLLENGADPKLESYFDNLTPLAAAVKYKNQTVIAVLDKMGVRQSWLNKFFSLNK